MKITISDETADDLRAMLARNGDDSDIEAFVQRTLAKRLLFETVAEARRQTADVPPQELSNAIDEAVTNMRRASHTSIDDADRP